MIQSRRRFFRGAGLLGLGLAGVVLAACGPAKPEVTATAVSVSSLTPAAPSASPTATPAAVRYDPDLHVLVDKQRVLPDGFVPPNVEGIPVAWHAGDASGQRLRADVIAAMQPMVKAAKADGVYLRVESAYRSYNEQVRTFAYWVSVLGEAQARRESAVPGHSEHQLGTTLDFADASNRWELVESFAGTPSGKWLAADAYKYGFAMSYPPGGEPITGYVYEPWHFRYIGVPAAEAWHASGKTLIEFLEALKARS